MTGPEVCHPYDEPCDYGTGGPCRNHGGVVKPPPLTGPEVDALAAAILAGIDHRHTDDDHPPCGWCRDRRQVEAWRQVWDRADEGEREHQQGSITTECPRCGWDKDCDDARRYAATKQAAETALRDLAEAYGVTA